MNLSLSQAASNALINFGGAMLIDLVFGHQWGVFDQYGFPLVLADNVTKVGYNNSSKVSSAPLENGTFAHYNKVANPYNMTVQMTKGSGGVFERGAFLAQIEALANSIDLFTIITPESIYRNCNITGYDYTREANDGARLLKVNIHFEQIREVTAQYVKKDVADTSAAQSPDAQNQVNNGQTQATNGENKSILATMAGK